MKSRFALYSTFERRDFCGSTTKLTSRFTLVGLEKCVADERENVRKCASQKRGILCVAVIRAREMKNCAISITHNRFVGRSVSGFFL